jgi:hypothetical protein
MRAILVSVDYADLLAITLPYNRHHFEEVWVMTTNGSQDAVEADKHGAIVHLTDAFYRDGATFNKWLALEEGLDTMGREGWICLMDADVLWPKELQFREQYQTIKWWNPNGETMYQDAGMLCSPLRRMWDNWPRHPQASLLCNQKMPMQDWVPAEEDWSKFPVHRNTAEWAGYSQIFHASDPVLQRGCPSCTGPLSEQAMSGPGDAACRRCGGGGQVPDVPWHQVDWRHAGGADSFFQAKWSAERKVRPPFEVLHLGPAGQNWYGRATPYADGSRPEGEQERRLACYRIWTKRRLNDLQGKDRFEGERISP